MPIGSPGSPVFVAGRGGPRPMTIFRGVGYQQPPRYIISGITRDSNSNPLGGCLVEVYESVSNIFRGDTTSDANGFYSIDVTGPSTGLTFFVVAYKVGASDVAGTTVNTLTGAPT